MGGMGGMDGMGGGMGGMAGFGGLGEMGMAGMYGNRMADMGDMENAGDAFQRDNLRGNDEYFNGVNGYYARGFGEELREPMGPMGPMGPMPMIDEPAVGRDKVPLGYEDRLRMPYFRPFRRHHYFDNEEDFDDEGFDNDVDEDEPYFVPAREHAALEEPVEEGPESDIDEGYDAPHDRKAKIAKVEKPDKKGKQKHDSHKLNKGHKDQSTLASKKDITMKREKTSGKLHERKH